MLLDEAPFLLQEIFGHRYVSTADFREQCEVRLLFTSLHTYMGLRTRCGESLSKNLRSRLPSLAQNRPRYLSTTRRRQMASSNDYVLKRERLKDIKIVNQIESKFILGTITSSYRNPKES